MGTTLSDLRLALRGFRRSPLFAGIAILSLALGIGANTAIFTLIDQILLRQLPIEAPSSSGCTRTIDARDGCRCSPG